jgi:hypothetical protein
MTNEERNILASKIYDQARKAYIESWNQGKRINGGNLLDHDYSWETLSPNSKNIWLAIADFKHEI